MQLTALYTDDAAVSEVIGVILMVGITVLLAATAATFFVGLGNQSPADAPRVAFAFDYEADETAPIREVVTIRHASGDAVGAEQLTVVVSDASTPSGGVSARRTWRSLGSGAPEEVAAGASVNVSRQSLRPGSPYPQLALDRAEIDVVWVDADTDQSFVLAEWKGPRGG